MTKFSQKSLIGKVEREMRQNHLIKPGDNIIVGLSGGPDSVCLLLALFELRDKFKFNLAVAHYNHRLRGRESDKDEKFVEELCHQRGIECYIGRAKKANLYKSEEEARTARYEFLKKVAGEKGGAKIALAHNSNDLIETFLFNLVRGSGLRGLRAIPRQKDFFLRPLLSIPRSEIISFLSHDKLAYRIDKSNNDLQFRRNFIRLEIIPRLLEINPNLVETISRTIETIEDDYNFLNQAASQALNKVLISRGPNQLLLNQNDFLLLPLALQRLVIRQCIDEIADLKNITLKQLDDVISVIQKRQGRKFKLLPHSLRIELNNGKIVIVKESDSSSRLQH